MTSNQDPVCFQRCAKAPGPLVVTAASDHWHNWDSRNGAVLPGQCSACAGGHTDREGSALHDAAAITGRNVLG